MLLSPVRTGRIRKRWHKGKPSPRVRVVPLVWPDHRQPAHLYPTIGAAGASRLDENCPFGLLGKRGRSYCPLHKELKRTKDSEVRERRQPRPKHLFFQGRASVPAVRQPKTLAYVPHIFRK